MRNLALELLILYPEIFSNEIISSDAVFTRIGTFVQSLALSMFFFKRRASYSLYLQIKEFWRAFEFFNLFLYKPWNYEP